MGILDVVTMLGAVATFLFGMTTMTDGLEKLSSGRLERILERLTDNVLKGVLLGAFVTGVIQSSAATTVMCVGFVNAGIMKLRQTVGIIMGANIGTTVTAQLLSLGDISSDMFVLQLLNPAVLGPALAVVGILFYMFISGGHKKDVGQIILGLGILFIGMKTMEVTVAPLQEMESFCNLFSTFSNPVMGALVGALVTALLQSSSASVGILQAMSSTGLVSFNIAFPIIMGQNIGTCITALLSGIGASKNAKRTATIHLLFNVIGTVFFMALLYIGHSIFKFDFWDNVMTRSSIANVHLMFNVACTVLLVPANALLVRLAERIVPGDIEEREVCVLDERFLSTPAIAIERSRDAVTQMGEFALENYGLAVEILNKYDSKKLERLNETEAAIDRLEGLLDNYLVRLTDRALSSDESIKVSELLHTLSDFERIGDYVVNLTECATIMHTRGMSFSAHARRELAEMTGAVGEAIELSVDSFKGSSRSKALQVEPLEEVVDLINDELKSRHIERLKTGACTIEQGTVFLELLVNLERISDHCSNVAMYIVRGTAHCDDIIKTDSHAYFRYLHLGGDETFNQWFDKYREKYFTNIVTEKITIE